MYPRPVTSFWRRSRSFFRHPTSAWLIGWCTISVGQTQFDTWILVRSQCAWLKFSLWRGWIPNIHRLNPISVAQSVVLGLSWSNLVVLGGPSMLGFGACKGTSLSIAWWVYKQNWEGLKLGMSLEKIGISPRKTWRTWAEIPAALSYSLHFKITFWQKLYTVPSSRSYFTNILW